MLTNDTTREKTRDRRASGEPSPEGMGWREMVPWQHRNRCERHGEEEWGGVGCQVAKVMGEAEEGGSYGDTSLSPRARRGWDMSKAHPLVPAGKGGTEERPAWELGARPLGLEVGVWRNTWDLAFRTVSRAPAPRPPWALAVPRGLVPAFSLGLSIHWGLMQERYIN